MDNIKVGDEIVSGTGDRCIVTRIADGVFYTLWCDGSCGATELEYIKYCELSGRHIDINAILDWLKEGV